MNEIICGVDVSKDWLDAHVEPGGAAQRFRNDAAGIAALGAFCRAEGAGLVVMEASGGYERLAFLLLWQAGQPCGLVNARNVRRFAEAMGALEKTDRIDAAMIARFGQARRAAPTPPPSPAQQHLRALVTRLSQVTDDLVANRQRKGAAADPEAVESLEEVIALLLAQRRHLEGEIASLIDDDPLWACLDRAFRQIKGVAERSVARLLAEVPEIGSFSNRAVSKLVGLAPWTRQSGQWKGKSRIGGGRAVVRTALSMGALVAGRHNPVLKAFRDKLVAAGKPHKLAAIAVARKLLTILNAIIRDRTPWNPQIA